MLLWERFKVFNFQDILMILHELNFKGVFAWIVRRVTVTELNICAIANMPQSFEFGFWEGLRFVIVALPGLVSYLFLAANELMIY